LTIKEFIRLLRREWLVAALAFGIVLAIGVAVAYLPAERWRSEATVIVQPRSDKSLQFGDAVATEFLLPAVVRQVEADSFRNEVAGEVRGQLSGTTLSDFSLAANNEPGTGIVTVQATSVQRQVPQLAANLATRRLVDRAISPIVEVIVLDPAQPAKSASAALRPPLLFGSLVLGLIFGVAAAIAAGTLRRRLDGADAIREQFGLDVLAEIPSQRHLPALVSDIFTKPEHRHAAEDYQRLRTVFEIVSRGKPAVAITSWTQGEGKTTVSAALAWSVAAAGKRVLAVDGDLRRPRLHQAYGLSNEAGVADVARGVHPDDIVQNGGLSTLEVMAAGQPDRHPTEVLRAAIPQLIDADEDRLIIVDTPPMFTPETTAVATLIDSVVIVLDGRRRQPSELETLIGDLRLAGTEILGVIITRARVPRVRQAAAYYYEPGRTAVPEAVETAHRGPRGRLRERR
jgi:capsular exopolysaccharide synthesis family protein